MSLSKHTICLLIILIITLIGTIHSQQIKTIAWTNVTILTQDEIKFLTEVGLTNMDALKAATLNNAKAIGIEDTYGSITVGKRTDLVVLSKNPLEDIKLIHSVKTIYKDGKEYIKK